MSTLKVNALTNVAGNTDITGVGKVLQIVSGTTSSSVSQSGASSGTQQSTITDTGLSAAITPTQASNKVLVLVHQQYAFTGDADLQVHYNIILRNGSGTNLHGQVGTPNQSGEGTLRYKNLAAFETYYCLNYLHSPNTTSSYTYKLSMNLQVNYGGSTTMYAQRNGNKSDIILLEIAA